MTHTKEYSRAYHHKNKLVYSVCECGKRVSNTGKSMHLKSVYHTNFLEKKGGFAPPPIPILIPINETINYEKYLIQDNSIEEEDERLQNSGIINW